MQQRMANQREKKKRISLLQIYAWNLWSVRARYAASADSRKTHVDDNNISIENLECFSFLFLILSMK